MRERQKSDNSGRANMAPGAALDWGFLRRTFIATIATTLIVALFATVYFDPAWGGRYLLFGLWSISFFSLTGLMFRYLLFSPNRIFGLAFAGLKMIFLFLPVLILWRLWPIPEVEGRGPQIWAMFLGITTPFIVLILRVLGFFMDAQRKGLLPGLAAEAAARGRADSNPGKGELKSHP